MTLEVRTAQAFSDKPHTDNSKEGDTILTGTPSGVGPVVPGDSVECTLTDSSGDTISTLSFTAIQRQGGYRFRE